MVRPDYASKPVDVLACGVCAWILLTGSYLWKIARAPDAVFVFVERQGLEKLAEAWKIIPNKLMSPEALDLIAKMTRVRPADRITVEEALCHPWFDPLR